MAYREIPLFHILNYQNRVIPAGWNVDAGKIFVLLFYFILEGKSEGERSDVGEWAAINHADGANAKHLFTQLKWKYNGNNLPANLLFNSGEIIEFIVLSEVHYFKVHVKFLAVVQFHTAPFMEHTIID